jgi:hypothetical protein
MPAILSGTSLSSTEWNTFCNELDMALKPATTIRKVMMAFMFLLPLIFVIFAITSFASFNSGGGGATSGFTGFIIGIVIMFGGSVVLMVIMTLSRSKISTGLRKVCDETSARHAGISFHVRYETRFWGYGGGYNDNVHVQTHEYIEVYVSNAARTNTYNNNNDVIPTVNAVSATPPPVQAYVVGVPTAPPKA